MTESKVQVDGVDYSVLYERPSNGDSKGHILLVHALMSNRHMWDNTVKQLNSAGYSTLRYDHIGHNRSSNPADQAKRYHMDDLTRHAHEIVKQVADQTHLKAVFGCSIGGVLALRYTMLFPGEVEKCIAMCAPGMTALEKAKPLWGERIVQFEKDEQDGSDVLCQATVKRWLPGDTAHDESVRQEALKHVRSCSLQGYKILADAIRGYDYEGEMDAVDWPPALVIAGSEDGAAPPDVLQRIASKVRGSRFVVLQGCGHIPPMHRPDDFHQLVLPFLKTDSGANASTRL